MSLPWSSKGSKVTPVNADQLMIIDSEDPTASTKNKLITVGSLPATENVLWTADHDAAGFDLLNVGGITISNPADTFQYIVTSSAIAADRILTIPLLTTNDVLVTEAFPQSFANKTLDDFTNVNHADTLHVQVRNESGVLIPKGTVVYVSGFDVPSDLPLVLDADASSSATMPAIGIVTEDISDATNGDVTASGVISAVDTTGMATGSTVYVSETAGEYTITKPTGTALIQNIGIVLEEGGASDGKLKVTSLDRTNDLPNIASANFWLGNASGVPTAVTMSSDATMDNAGALTVANNAITDAKTDTFTTTKISTLNKALLNTAIVYNDQTNTFGDFAQIFPDNQLFIQNPAATFEYQIIADAIVADRTVTFPLLTGNDTFVTEAFAQTLTNKTVDADNNTVTNIGASEVESGIITDQTLKATAVGADEVLLSDSAAAGALKRTTVTQFLTTIAQTPWAQDVDAAGFDLLNVGGITINNPADTFQYIVTPAAIAADRILNLPLMTGTDTITLNDFAATLTNKTLTTPTIASFTNATHDHSNAAGGGTLLSTSALSDTTNIAYLNTANVYTAGTRQDFLGLLAGTAGVNVGGIAGNPTTQVDGDIWVNTSTNQIFARVNSINVDLGASGAGSPPFADTTSIVEGSADPTKEIRFEVDGLTTGTIRVITPPDADITLVNTSDGVVKSTNVDSTIAVTNGANTFGDFAQTFADNQIFIQNPAGTFEYQISAAGIAADRTITLPLLTGNTNMVVTDFANVWGTPNQNIAATGKWQEGGVSISPIGTQTIWANSGAWISTITNGAEFLSRELPTNDVMISSFNFDATTSESAQVQWVPPPNWDAGTIRFRLYWTNASGLTTETIDFDLAGRAYADSDAIDQVTGTAQNVTDTWLAQNDVHITSYSSAITLIGTPTAGDLVILKLSRDVAADDLTGDAEILGIEIEYSLDAATAT